MPPANLVSSSLCRAVHLLQSHFGQHALEQAESGGPLPVRAKLEEMLGDYPQARRTWAAVQQIRQVSKKRAADTLALCLLTELHMGRLPMAKGIPGR